MSEALALAAFLEATVRVATPLGLAAVGETGTERSGVINIGLEGGMLAGALASAMVALNGGPWAGMAAAALAGMLLAAVFAVVTVHLGGDQIVTGTAVTLGAVGLTGAVYRAAFGTTGAALTLPTFAPVRAPLLSDIPVAGEALFAQPWPTWFLFAVTAATWLVLSRMQVGLALRAVGEAPRAAAAAGLDVKRIRLVATLAGGALGGMAGGALVLAQAGTFAERMTAGRGFHRDRDRGAGALASFRRIGGGPRVRGGQRATIRVPGGRDRSSVPGFSDGPLRAHASCAGWGGRQGAGAGGVRKKRWVMGDGVR